MEVKNLMAAKENLEAKKNLNEEGSGSGPDTELGINKNELKSIVSKQRVIKMNTKQVEHELTSEGRQYISLMNVELDSEKDVKTLQREIKKSYSKKTG